MTTKTMDLQALLEKTTGTDFLRHMIGFSAQRLMELEAPAPPPPGRRGNPRSDDGRTP